MEESQYDILLKKIERLEDKQDSIAADVNRMDADMADDRKNLSEMNLKLKNLNDSHETTREELSNFQKKLSETVRDAVHQALKPIENKIDDWVEKKVIRTRAKKRNLIESFKDYWKKINDNSWKKEVSKDGK